MSIHYKTPQPSEDPAPECKGGRFTPQHNHGSTEALTQGVEQTITGQVDSSDSTGFSNPTLGYSCTCTKTLPTSSGEQGNELNSERGTSLTPFQGTNSEIRYYQFNILDICVSSLYYSKEEWRAPVDSEPYKH